MIWNSRKDKTIVIESRSLVVKDQGLGWEDSTKSFEQIYWGNGNVLCHDCGVGHPTECSLNRNFIVCKLYITKPDQKNIKKL